MELLSQMTFIIALKSYNTHFFQLQLSGSYLRNPLPQALQVGREKIFAAHFLSTVALLCSWVSNFVDAMTRIQSNNGSRFEVGENEQTPPDIRRWELEVVKNVLCIAVFAGLLGYSVASSVQGHNTILSILFYIVTSLGLMYFIPRLIYSTYKFMSSSAVPDYEALTPENEGIYAI